MDNEREGRKLIPELVTFVVAISVLAFAGCSKGSTDKSEEGPSGSSIRFRQYYVQGQQLYLQHCSNCHQENGTGLGLVYPPLNKSDYMTEKFEDVVCLIRNGKQGEITVNGKSYIQGMPGIPALTDLEVAEIITYIYNTWEHQRGLVEVKEVSTILNKCENSAL